MRDGRSGFETKTYHHCGGPRTGLASTGTTEATWQTRRAADYRHSGSSRHCTTCDSRSAPPLVLKRSRRLGAFPRFPLQSQAPLSSLPRLVPLHPTESVASLRPTLAAAAARLCGRLALAVVLLTLAASAATFRYRETLTIEWGTVTFSDAGASVTQDMWFTRQMPTFATDTQFTEGQRSCLRAGFELRRGTVGGQSVWRLDPSLTSDLQSKVRPTECEGLSIQGVGSVPADWSPGDAKTISWPLVVRGERTGPRVGDPLPPQREFALLLGYLPPRPS